MLKNPNEANSTSLHSPEDYEKILKENEVLKEKKIERDEYIALGNFNAARLKVLHLKDNPLSEKLHLVKPSLSPRQLESESDTELMPPPTTSQAIQNEMDMLKKRIERMKEVFALQTNRFRDAVYFVLEFPNKFVDINLQDGISI